MLPCEQCGRPKKHQRSNVENNKRHYCSRECVWKAQDTRFEKACECGCGRTFLTTPKEGHEGPRRFFELKCSAGMQSPNAPRYEIGGEKYTLGELAGVSGLSHGGIARRLRNGMAWMQALMAPKHTRAHAPRARHCSKCGAIGHDKRKCLEAETKNAP